MTTQANMLLVGALPPEPSHAALLTQAIADLLATNGIEVTCMIDCIAPPPVESISHTIIRPSTPEFLQGDYDDSPRLYVLGGDGGSLMALEMLHASPGPVLLAEDSLFSLVEAWLQHVEDPDHALHHWLSNVHGTAGETLARSIFQHRRTSASIGDEIAALDMLLAPATHIFTLGQHYGPSAPKAATTIMEAFYPVATIPDRKEDHTLPKTDGKLRILVIGLDTEYQCILAKKLVEMVGGPDISISFTGRFAHNVHDMVLGADVVAILDGQEITYCPHAHKAITNSKAIVHASQKWSSVFPLGATLMVDHPNATDQLAMVFAALARTKGLLAALVEKAAIDVSRVSQGEAYWSNQLLSAAKTASAISHPTTLKLDCPTGHWGNEDDTAITTNLKSAVALIGAVPAQPILARLLPNIKPDSCPRFITPELASTLAAVMDQPRSKLVNQMGFEASLVSATATLPSMDVDRKVRPWHIIQRGMRRAETGITFGCRVEGLSPAPYNNTTLSTCWSFHPPHPKDPQTGIETGYDTAAGVYWVYDGARRALRLLVFTGTAGSLELSSTGKAKFVISDQSQTTLIGGGEKSKLGVAAHGVACIHMAAAPDESGHVNDLMKTLAEQGLYLEWSPCEK